MKKVYIYFWRHLGVIERDSHNLSEREKKGGKFSLFFSVFDVRTNGFTFNIHVSPDFQIVINETLFLALQRSQFPRTQRLIIFFIRWKRFLKISRTMGFSEYLITPFSAFFQSCETNKQSKDKVISFFFSCSINEFTKRLLNLIHLQAKTLEIFHDWYLILNHI